MKSKLAHWWHLWCVWVMNRATKRKPDFIVGSKDNPYMLRWWVLPRNPLFNVYLHCFLRDDDDRALHDHPWVSLSYCIAGSLREVRPLFQEQPPSEDFEPAGTVFYDIYTRQWTKRGAAWRHRLELRSKVAWTVFITGPVVRDWGFHCHHGWRHYKDFVEIRDNVSGVGRGCA